MNLSETQSATIASSCRWVQHFLYGEAYEREAVRGYGESPIYVARRGDVKGARVTLGDEAPAIDLELAHVDLYFFHDVDIVLLTIEVAAGQLPLAVAQDVMFRLGRAYPAGWDEHGRALHCASRVEWLGAEGEVLAASDFRGASATWPRAGVPQPVARDRGSALGVPSRADGSSTPVKGAGATPLQAC